MERRVAQTRVGPSPELTHFGVLAACLQDAARARDGEAGRQARIFILFECSIFDPARSCVFSSSSVLQVLLFSGAVSDAAKQELAWATFGAHLRLIYILFNSHHSQNCPAPPQALLSATPASLVVLWSPAGPLCVRGTLGRGAAGDDATVLTQLGAAVQPAAEAACAANTQQARPCVASALTYHRTTTKTCISSLQYSARLSDVANVLSSLSTGSLLAQPCGPRACLLLFAPRADAFGLKARAWVAALGAKLSEELGET